MTREHEEYRESIGAYLLGALPELEVTALERHLEACSACHTELERLRPAVDALARGVPPATPSPKLKRELLAAVRRESGADDGRPERAPRRRRLRVLSLRPAAAAALAAGLVALGVGIGLGAGSLGDNRDGGGRVVAAQVDRTRAPAARASLAVGEGDAGAVLRVTRMPQLGARRVYQVWIKREGRVAPGTLFEVRSDGTGAAGLPEGVRGADAVLVTREPRGGSQAPSEAPLLRVRL